MKQTILNLATSLAQRYGLNAFSYQDIAKQVGIAKASIHHHFPSKHDLAEQILDNYINIFLDHLTAIQQLNIPNANKFTHYAGLFRQVAVTQDKLCLCFMYAHDYLNLNAPLQTMLQQFYLANEVWLTKLLDMQDKQIAQQQAILIFSSLQGLLVRNRIIPDLSEFDLVLEQLKQQYFAENR